MKKMSAFLFALIFVFSASFVYADELKDLGKRLQEALTIIEEGYYKELTPENKKAFTQGLEKTLNEIVYKKLDPHSFFRLTPQEKTTSGKSGENYVGVGVSISAHPEDTTEYLKELKTLSGKRISNPITEAEHKIWEQEMKLIFSKAQGLIIGKRGIYIKQVFKNSGAHLAGVKRGWSIVSVEDEKGKMENVAGMEHKNATGLIKGEYLKKGSENTTVRIRFAKPDGEEVVLQILRKATALETVWGEMKTDDIGYIQIISFGLDTAKGFEDAVSELKKRGMKKLMIDVRNNSGGLENATDGVLDRLVPPGRIMLFHEKRGQKDIVFYSDYSVPVIFEGPIVVLTNENSASASEVLAGVLKDHNLATIVGEKTYGKGLVQSNGKMENGGEFYITTFEYILPVSGHRVQGKGIEPHISVADDPLTLKDEPLEMAIEVLKTK